MADQPSLLERYLMLGLRVGRHIDGFVDAYDGPTGFVERVAGEAPADPPPFLPRRAVEFLTDPTWRAYITCYIEGMPLCRRFVGGRPERFERLISEQLLPADLDGVGAA